jgi:hypothetical protein
MVVTFFNIIFILLCTANTLTVVLSHNPKSIPNCLQENSYYCCSCFCMLMALTYPQKKNATYQYHIKRAAIAHKNRWVVDEADWLKADTATNFFMVYLWIPALPNCVQPWCAWLMITTTFTLSAVCYTATPGPIW